MWQSKRVGKFLQKNKKEKKNNPNFISSHMASWWTSIILDTLALYFHISRLYPTLCWTDRGLSHREVNCKLLQPILLWSLTVIFWFEQTLETSVCQTCVLYKVQSIQCLQRQRRMQPRNTKWLEQKRHKTTPPNVFSSVMKHSSIFLKLTACFG